MQSGNYRIASFYWNRFIKSNPTGSYRAQALLDMADFMLFKQYNINSASKKLNHIARSIQYLVANAHIPTKTKDKSKDSSAQKDEPRPSGSGRQNEKDKNPYNLFLLTEPQFSALPASWQQAYCSFLRRRGLISWVLGNPKRGAALMKASTSYKPIPSNNFSDSRSISGKRMKWLIERMKNGRMKAFGQIIPIANQHRARTNIAILLGEVYFSAVKLYVAINYFLDVAHSNGRLHPSADQRAFAHIRLGQCAKLLFKTKAAYKQYQAVLSDYQLKNTPWSPQVALQSALLIYQSGSNWRKAVVTCPHFMYQLL